MLETDAYLIMPVCIFLSKCPKWLLSPVKKTFEIMKANKGTVHYV